MIDEARERLGHDGQLVHYFAVPPVAFPELTRALGEHDLATGSRVVYEKPFGTSEEGFRELDEAVHKVLSEDQVFRIDHFLGKEATQNLHVLRFANGLFDAAWSKERIRAVQIDVPEKIGVTDRAVFYDATGAVLDMLVTHLFQVAAEVAMEPPESLSAEHLQAAREEVIGAFRPIDPDEVVLGQFEGYRDLDGVAKDSRTDTYVAARLWIDNDRWRGVPFLLRTGKRLAFSRQRVSLILREPSGPLADVPKNGNVLAFDLSGSGTIDLRLVAKRPGPTLELDVADTDAAAREPARRRPAAAVRPAHPRRAVRRPVAVHPPGRAGRGLDRRRTAARGAAGAPAVPARVVGTGGGAGPRRAGWLGTGRIGRDFC